MKMTAVPTPELKRIDQRLMAAIDAALAESIVDEAERERYWRDPATWEAIGPSANAFADACRAASKGEASRQDVIDRASALLNAVKSNARSRSARA